MSHNLAGTRLGSYCLLELIGEGASGWVYSAQLDPSERKVAIKFLRRELLGDDSCVKRFLAEARAMSAVGHPNVVQVLGTGEHDGGHYIVMELLEGETLEARVEREQRLSLESALPIFLEVTDALAAAHDRGIVHRDIKPENIFLCKRADGSEHAKVLDFGIAKLEDAKAAGLTVRGAILGTPEYMSPEQCMGEDTLDLRSDIYSLGLVLYRMLTGQLPYEITNHHVMRYVLAHTQEQPRSPRSIVPELPPTIDTVLLRALAKRPDQRFKNMHEFAAALAPLRSAKETLALVSAMVDDKMADDMAPNLAQPRRAASAVARFVLEGIHAGTLQLPSLPTAALRCIELLRSPRFTTAALVDILGRDPLLASQVVGRANAAIIPGASPARTLDQAIARLGTRPLANLLFEVSTRRLFESRDAGIRQAFQILWDHSIGVALVAQALAKRLRADADLSYLAGLLHDVGKPVVGTILLEAERVAARKPKAWHSRETWLALISACHREIGFSMARAWRLPDEVLLAIARSDHYSIDGFPSPVNLVCLANALVKRAGMYPRAVEDTEYAPLIEEGSRIFSLTDKDLEAILLPLVAHKSRPSAAPPS
jgi:putative nucleotidyltransferase with HDIG domain